MKFCNTLRLRPSSICGKFGGSDQVEFSSHVYNGFAAGNWAPGGFAPIDSCVWRSAIYVNGFTLTNSHPPIGLRVDRITCADKFCPWYIRFSRAARKVAARCNPKSKVNEPRCRCSRFDRLAERTC